MTKNYRSEIIGLVGNPVDENPTVITQEAGFAAAGLDFRYVTTRVLPEDLEAAVNGMRALGYRGFNVTIPHKVEVLKYLDEITDEAMVMGAVNTVLIKDGKLYGENTDGKGFVISLEDAGVKIQDSNVVIFGAGGAARAIVVELALHGAKNITVVNRSVERGKALVRLINEKTSAKADFIKWDGTFTIPQETDIIVQATSIGLFPDTEAVPDIDFGTILPTMAVCDGIPNPPHTTFLKKAEERGAKTVNGTRMLVNQAGFGFTIWTGKPAPIKEMYEATIKEFE